MVRELVAPTKIPAVLPASCAADPTNQEALIADRPNALESKAQLALNLAENELHDIMRSTCKKEPMGVERMVLYLSGNQRSSRSCRPSLLHGVWCLLR